jgi:hypothetical protein
MNLQRLFFNGFSVLLLVVLAGCASLPNATREQLNDRHIEFALSRHDTIPVVFENGLGGRMEWWKKVIPISPSCIPALNKFGGERIWY